MKTFVKIIFISMILAGCSDSYNSRLVPGPSTNAGSSSNPLGPDFPVDDPTNRCQHPDAVNFSSYSNNFPGPCIFYTCKDVEFADQYLLSQYNDYVEKYGGEIVHFDNLCVDDTDSGNGGDVPACKHPKAENFGKKEECLFKACGQAGFIEYQAYLEFQAYITANSSGKIIVDNTLCKTAIQVAGCKDPKAMNVDPKATVEDGSCRFAFCSDPKFKEFAETQNASLLDHVKKYATDWGTSLAQVQGVNTCKTPVENEEAKCEDVRAVNTGEKGICIFKACSKPDYVEYNFYLEIKKYLEENPKFAGRLEKDDSLCKTVKPNLGCLDPSADNYDGTKGYNQENGSCKWNVCLNKKYQEYFPKANYLLIQHMTSYASKYNKDIYDLVLNSTCKTILGDKVKGCTEPKAANFNQYAEIEDGTCQFDVCLDCKYKEHGLPENLAVIKTMNKYAADHGLKVHNLVASSTCKTLHDKKGCTIPIALNYDPSATIENGTCNFKACINCRPHQYPEYNQEIKDIIQDYYYLLANLHIPKHSVVVYNTCHKQTYTVRLVLDDACLLKNQAVPVRISVGTEVFTDNILTAAQNEAKAVHLKDGTKYKVEIYSQGAEKSQYTIDRKGHLIEQEVEGHIKHKVYCSKE